MSELTKEWLQKTIAELEEERDAMPGAVNEDAAMALAALRIALASLEAEAVCVIDQSNLDYLKSGSDADVWPASRTEMGDVLLYRAAPPAAPVSVPDLKPVGFLFVSDDGAVAYSPADWPMKGFNLIGPIYGDVNACRAAMLQGAEHVSNRDELPLGYLQGHKDGLEWAAQLAEANHPQTGDWLYDDPIALAAAIRKGPDMPEADGNSPAIPDGWVACSERMPSPSTGVIVAAPWQSAPGGYAMKWATNCPGHPDADTDGWIIPGASWRPTHWMPLPAAPQQEV
ncbi:DUF551 domain-containing protein [Enterobacter hormaechei]|uniref:DUF551 domain-containing protein n=1 Tax=Enterobacter hormaechei TaxID=158836 RepID=UPI002AF6B0AB|nr:DUF551 domain-containing protein [Enterobacter hormaechei]MEA1204835.1 DUF551 domain-containing protein [Enterobacter hormaechei]